MISIEFFNTFLGIGVIILQIITVLGIAALITKIPSIGNTLSKYGLFILRIVFVGAVSGSLLYEHMFGYTPCILCWYQRLAIFPIGFIALSSNFKNQQVVRRIIRSLTAYGLIIAAIHIFIDFYPSAGDICGQGPSCLIRYVYVFNYVTIPVMSATVLALALVLSFIVTRYPQQGLAEQS